MESILAKVVCGIDKGQLGWAAKRNGALSQSRGLGNHVSDNVVEMHAVRPSARRNPTGMGAHVAHPVSTCDFNKLRAPTCPRFVAEPRAGSNSLLSYRYTPGINTDNYLRIPRSKFCDKRHYAFDFSSSNDCLTVFSLLSADIDDACALSAVFFTARQSASHPPGRSF